jgi:MFS family permease
MEGNDRSIATFTMLGHGLVHWFEMSIPILLVVWLEVFPESVALVGLIIALGYAPFGLGALPGGILADRFGTRRLILLCFAGMSLAFLALSLATSIYFVGVALIMWGIAASVYHPAGMALISTGAERRGTVFAWHGIAGNIGIALGPFTTASLLIFFDWQLVTALLALPGIAAIIYGVTVDFDPTAAVDEEVDADSGTALTLPTFLSNSKTLLASAFVIMFVLVGFEGLFYRGILTFLPEILQDLDAMADISLSASLEGIEPSDYVFVGLLIVGMLGQYAGGKLSERISVERGLVIFFVILAGLAVAFVPVSAMGLGPLLVICALIGFFLFGIQPFYQVGVALYTPPETRGLSYGYTYMGEFGFGAFSIAIGGFVIGAYSVATFFAILAGFALVGGSLALVLLMGHSRSSFLERYDSEAAD